MNGEINEWENGAYMLISNNLFDFKAKSPFKNHCFILLCPFINIDIIYKIGLSFIYKYHFPNSTLLGICVCWFFPSKSHRLLGWVTTKSVIEKQKSRMFKYK